MMLYTHFVFFCQHHCNYYIPYSLYFSVTGMLLLKSLHVICDWGNKFLTIAECTKILPRLVTVWYCGAMRLIFILECTQDTAPHSASPRKRPSMDAERGGATAWWENCTQERRTVEYMGSNNGISDQYAVGVGSNGEQLRELKDFSTVLEHHQMHY